MGSATTELIEAGKIAPVIDRQYPLAEVPEALRYLEAGQARERSSSPYEARLDR
jgi:NADPH:quinone reductase-like Zn-dependent oxidoreductase